MKLWRSGFIAALTWSCAAGAHAELANAIRAIVNDAVITYHEVQSLNEQTADRVVAQYGTSRSAIEKKLAEMENENLDKLVERQLILHEFKTAGYSLPDSVLDELVQETIKNDFGDRPTLTKTLEARGMSYEKFRQQIKERFIEAQLRLKNISAEIIISPHKIENYYEAHKEEFKEEDQVKLRRIILNKSSDAGAPDAKVLGEEIVARLKEGATFDEMASIYSQDRLQSHEGTWYTRSALRRELADVAFALKPGECSGVIDTGTDCYVLRVDEVNKSHYKTLGEVRALIEQTLKREEQNRLEKQWLAKLRKKTFVQIFY
ncbi:MAG TPA: peptidyl-prolyl cis-trans isomerase [Verrucomicrobiae bacterium]|nr:peptidyl-prolyl cis-trans isomerase [Verrucomicrobiae bacterium]